MQTNLIHTNLACLLLSTLVAAPMAAQATYGWTQVATTGPSARIGHGMAYDSQRARTVLFGGGNNSGIFGDTWEWDGANWTHVASTGPADRTGTCMVYDSQRGRTVLFGGVRYNALHLGDTWEWDGSSWTQVASTGPFGRTDHGMAYDSQRGRTVLFGGRINGGIFGDTWEWDGSSWTQVATSGPSGIPRRAMTYDVQRGRTVVCYVGFLSETWEWDGGIWTLAAATAPTYGGAMAYDSQRGCAVQFSGSTARHTSEWDGRNWTWVDSGGPMAGGTIVYDSQRGRTVLFGGYDDTFYNYFGDTFELNAGHTSIAATFGTGCGSLPLELLPYARPIINRAALAYLANLPSSLAFVALGWSRTAIGPIALPISLSSFGMPGCDLLQSTEFVALPVTSSSATTAGFRMQLPNLPSLIGLHAYLQGWAYAPGVNAAQVIVSNGIELVIGDW